MPITTSSEKALEYYLEGRSLNERLRGQESSALFQKAVADDPGFALGHLNLSFVLPTAKGFFETFAKAKAREAHRKPCRTSRRPLGKRKRGELGLIGPHVTLR